MDQQTKTFVFIAYSGTFVLGSAAFLAFSHIIDGAAFLTLAGTFLGGVVGLLAPSPIAVGKTSS